MVEARRTRRPVIAPTRVMVAVASAQRRTQVSRWLDGRPDLAVVAVHRDPGAAVADLDRSRADVIVIDPETAALGFAEFATLRMRRPDLPVLMVRADGSPGKPVERFGQWAGRGAGDGDMATARLADVLAAAIRQAAIGPAGQRPTAPSSRHAASSVVH